MDFARANLVKDPAIAAEALKAVLAVHPDHQDAKSLLAKLPAAARGPEAAPAAPTSAEPSAAVANGMGSVTGWKDLLAAKHFNEGTGWEYQPGLLTIDNSGSGTISHARDGSATGARFAVELEARVIDTNHRDGGAGLAFGWRGNDLYVLSLCENALVLSRVQAGDATDVVRVDLVPGGKDIWHKFGVLVRGRKLEIWLDGARKAEHDNVQRENLVGDMGFLQQECKIEFRLIRVGQVGQ